MTIVFDFDGVLADSIADIAGAVQAAQRQFECPVWTIDEISKYVGHGASYLVKNCLPSADPSMHDTILVWYREYYMAHSVIETRLYPGVEECLKQFRASGVHMAVLSNKPEPLCVKILKELGIAPYFTCIYGPESLSNMKPDPEGIFKALSITGDTPENCFMVGDTFSDVLAGKNAGCKTAGVLYGIGDREKLLAQSADYYIKENLLELFDIVFNLNKLQ